MLSIHEGPTIPSMHRTGSWIGLLRMVFGKYNTPSTDPPDDVSVSNPSTKLSTNRHLVIVAIVIRFWLRGCQRCRLDGGQVHPLNVLQHLDLALDQGSVSIEPYFALTGHGYHARVNNQVQLG